MIRACLGWFLVVASFCKANAFDDPPYAVSRIADSLRTDASAVIRSWTGLFEVKNSAEATFRVQRAVTILSSKGRDWGEFEQIYDPFLTIEDLEGTIYDAEGNEVRSLEKKDIDDYSAVDAGTLFDDNRVRAASLYHDAYPYTVVYEYELLYRGSLQWPTWVAQSTDDPVEYSSFTVQAPVDAGLRHWCNRSDLRPSIKEEDGMVKYEWTVRSLAHIPDDVVGHIEDVSPIVRIAPREFEMSGHKGRMDTWKDFGAWMWKLYEGRGDLPSGERTKLQAQIRANASPRERAQSVYRYLQTGTRYVSVQLGIGGWRPFDAAFVSERKYGDCKALSNYAIALLREVGVQAYPVIIYAGDRPRPMITEFPSNQFNHVVVCVPIEKDTMWLECTNRTMAFGQLSATCSDRDALMITPEGGVVVHVPLRSAAANTQVRTGEIRIRWDGSGTALAKTRYTGYQQQEIRGRLMEVSSSDRQKWVTNRIPVATPKLTYHRIGGLEEPGDTVAVTMSFEAPKIASLSGNRLFLVPNLFERTVSAPAKISKRLSPVRFPYPYIDCDSILYHIPADMKIEALPAPTEIVTPYAVYRSKCQPLGDSAIMFIRMLERSKRIIPAEDYEVHRTFMINVSKADNAQAVLVKR